MGGLRVSWPDFLAGASVGAVAATVVAVLFLGVAACLPRRTAAAAGPAPEADDGTPARDDGWDPGDGGPAVAPGDDLELTAA